MHNAKNAGPSRLGTALVGFGGFLALASGSGAARAADAAFETDELEEVKVTARRREESLQDTPVAVTVITSRQLEDMQITGTTDLDKVVPNLQFHSYGTLTGNNSAAQIFIRGIGQTDATPAVDPGVGLYIDDVYMGRSVGGAMELRDIATTQVLRGPQGTLFGRNTIGGAVLLTTKALAKALAHVARLHWRRQYHRPSALSTSSTRQWSARVSGRRSKA